MRKEVEKLRQWCILSQLRFCIMTANDVIRLTEEPKSDYRAFRQIVTELQNTFERELRQELCFKLEAGDDFYYGDQPLFGEQVNQRFPSAGFDITEAGRSLAVDRFTASVFHLMRVMEVSLRSVAKGLTIPDPVKEGDRNWGAMLRKIREKMDENTKLRSSDQAWSGVKGFFEDVYIHISAVKNAWRNPTMHIESKYTKEEAQRIFDATKNFMEALAERMDEEGATRDSLVRNLEATDL